MATKPTVRIPRWGRLGSQVEPNAGKEDTGFVVSERPPAGWVNWILNALGEWGWYFNAVTDEIQAAFPETVRTRALGRMHSPGGSVSTPVITSTVTDVGIDTPQSGDVTSTSITVRFTTAFADTKYTPIVTMAYTTPAYTAVAIATSTTTMAVNFFDDAGSGVNPLTTSIGFYMDVKGAI